MRGGIVAVLVIVGLSIAALPPAAAAEIKPYEKVTGEVSGSLKCVGSDTMNNLVAHWAEGFKKFYPSVQEGIEGKGSASGPPALTEGTSTFGPMSRDWKPSEIDTFKEKHGYAPTVLPTAIAAAALSCVLKMLHEAQRTSAPRSTNVSMSTAVCTVMPLT